jgi:hypothetical protein
LAPDELADRFHGGLLGGEEIIIRPGEHPLFDDRGLPQSGIALHLWSSENPRAPVAEEVWEQIPPCFWIDFAPFPDA